MRWEARAPGKVNLSLILGPTRADGRHELVTLIESLSLADEVTLTVRPGAAADEVRCPGVEGPNLASAALAELRRAGWRAPPVTVEIAKRVPVAAGMGGGSADAAATLRLAAAAAPYPDGFDLLAVAAGLGADVPSQLEPGVVLGTGAGDVIAPAPPLAPHELVIVPLGEALSTAAVYREADRLGLSRPPAELAARRRSLEAQAPGAELPAALFVNDLQPASISLCPPIAYALAAVREAGSDHAFVCGSGPTVAGLFWGASERAAAAVEALRVRCPAATAAEPVGPAFGAVRRVG
jgi:4-diphosphocytidyl-2-C-methyl-D-erythritol kinase